MGHYITYVVTLYIDNKYYAGHSFVTVFLYEYMLPDISLVVSCNVSDDYMNIFTSFFKTSTGNIDN